MPPEPKNQADDKGAQQTKADEAARADDEAKKKAADEKAKAQGADQAAKATDASAKQANANAAQADANVAKTEEQKLEQAGNPPQPSPSQAQADAIKEGEYKRDGNENREVQAADKGDPNYKTRG